MSLAPLSPDEIEDATVLFEDTFCNTPKAVIAAPFAIAAIVALCGSSDFAVKHAKGNDRLFEEVLDTPDSFSVLYFYRPSANSPRPFYVGVQRDGGPK